MNLRPFLFSLPFLVAALAQVGLVDGPRPSSEVRGTLQGNARDGYKVNVEFLVDAGGNPVQQSFNQPLYWSGSFYNCSFGCATYRLRGFVSRTIYLQQVFDIEDSLGNLRGRAGVDTVFDSQNQPSYYRVEVALWPSQGTKVWRPSPDNPVPMEDGGWLRVTPPGGSAFERYRYPGMESYRAPRTDGLLSNLSPTDRDVVEGIKIDSLTLLRQTFGKVARGSILYLVVPDVSLWARRIAQEWQSVVGGQARYVLPKSKALEYCRANPNDPMLYVLPRDVIEARQSLGVAYPSSGTKQPGLVLVGEALYQDPGWTNSGSDYVSFTTILIPLVDGLPRAQAYVWGYLSQANLQAQVSFEERTLSSTPNRSYYEWFALVWDGRFQVDVGAGVEDFYLENFVRPQVGSKSFTIRDEAGRERGTGTVWVWWGQLYLIASLKGWTVWWRNATDNNRPVGAGGEVVSEGKRYRVPGLEGYLQSSKNYIEAAFGDPLVSYVSRMLDASSNPWGRSGTADAREWFKPLRDFCAGR